MILNYLPCVGNREDWGPERGYTIEKTKVVDESVVVLGRITFNGEECDYFVARYTRDGDRWPGSSSGGMRWWWRARESALRTYDSIRQTRGPRIDPAKAALVAEHFGAERGAAS